MEKQKKMPLIQSLWIGDELSAMEKLSMVSFIANGHPFHLYIYKDIKGVPDKVVLKDANRILPEEKIFKYRDYDSYAGFADLFRYKLLLEKGGFWVDADVVCLQPFQFSSDYIFASEVSALSKGERGPIKKITNCIIKAPRGSGIMEYCYNASAGKDPQSLNWGETGPFLLSKAVLQKFKMHHYVLKPEVFCPVPFLYWKLFITGQLSAETARRINRLTQDSYAIHLYNEMWRRNNIDKSAVFEPESIYERLKRRYLISCKLIGCSR